MERMRAYAAARGYRVVGEYKEVASGLNAERKMLRQILDRDDYGVLVAEHRDRLTRFGLSYLDQLLGRLGVKVDIINQVDGKDNELVDDFVSIVTSFCGRIYGQKRRAKTNRIIDEIREANKKGGVPSGQQKEDADQVDQG
jgi:predicted site-specific integrase-resolvase